MKRLQGMIWSLPIAFFLSIRPALADHIAIVYCAVDEKNDVRVIAADANPTGEVWTGGKRGQSCSLVLHELMSLGYEISHTEALNFMNIGFVISRTYVSDVPASSGQKPQPAPEGTRSMEETTARNAPQERGHIVIVLKKTAPHK
jgi:hypothetical protein